MQGTRSHPQRINPEDKILGLTIQPMYTKFGNKRTEITTFMTFLNFGNTDLFTKNNRRHV